MSIDRQRNGLLDQNKLIAAFFVILLHSPFPQVAGEIFESLARFAVPFFFMVSGFYVYGKTGAAIKKRLLKNLLLLASALVLYVVWDLAWSLYHGNTEEKLMTWFSASSFIDTFIFNNGALLGHLWFILSLVYCYMIYLVMGKCSFNAKLAISATLLASNFVFTAFLRILGVADPGYFTRNFLFTGLPFFTFGELFAHRKHSLQGKPALLWAMLTAGIILTLLQRFYLGISELYLGSVLTCVAFFALTLSHPLSSSALLSHIGKTTATGIYVLHVMVLACINMAGSVLGLLHSNIFLVLRPFVTFLLSVFASYVIYIAKTKITSRSVQK